MLKIKLLFISIIILFTSNSQQFNFKNYSLEEGLSRSGVYHILQDTYGFLWVATDGGGLCKFDGVNFVNYTRQDGLASEKVRIIFEDRDSILWFGTDKGLSFFNGKRFETITSKNGLGDNYIRSITQDKSGNLWIGTNRGISIIDPTIKKVSEKLKINFNLPHRKTRSILADTLNDIIWIGTDAGLCKLEKEKITIINTKDGLVDDKILSLFIDSKQNLWVGTNQGLSKISNSKITNWTTKNGLINNRVRSINEDFYHNIWLGTKTGVSVFNHENFTNLSLQNGLSNERIRCIQTDNFNNIWLGTYFGGIMRFNYKDFIGFTTKDGLVSNQILTITGDENNDIIVGSFDGVSKLKIIDNKVSKVKHITTDNHLISNNVQAILKDSNGVYWYGTDKGITIIKDNKPIQITKKDGLLSDNITVISFINGVFYIGTTKGLAEIILNKDYSIKSLIFTTMNNGLAGESISFIKENADHQIWIGFIDGQISILHNHQMSNPVLPNNIKEITAISFKDNIAFLGTNGSGVYTGVFNVKSKELELKNISTKQNLSSNYIFSILYHNQKVWIGNEKGIDLIELDSDSTYKIQSFGPERGFLGLQNNLNASYIDKKGNLWFGTVNGLFCLKNKELSIYSEGKETINYIKSIFINHKKVDWNNSEYTSETGGVFGLPKNLKLAHDKNNIAFSLTALNYVAPEKVLYTYKLEGYDKEWSLLSTKKYCEYTNLEPGNYSLLFKSTNEKGELLNKVTSFNFTIQKPFWMSWWFRILLIITSLWLLLYILNRRTKKLIQKQKDLENIIALRTQEITEQKNQLEDTKKEVQLQNDQLQFKNKEITDSIYYSRRIQRSILPSQEKTNQLLNNFFIFYKPKDIVSGDFYWLEKSNISQQKTFFGVADCTGHGVPGAMVSLICTRALTGSLKEHLLDSPSDILDKTTEIVTEAFTDNETGKIIKDGMDIVICSLDYSKYNNFAQFECAAAQNSIWIVTPIEEDNLNVNDFEIKPDITTDTHKLFTIRGNKQPIGHFDNKKPFINYSCSLVKGTKIYLFTDGYPDQFGGDEAAILKGGKKYKYKPLKQFLLNLQHKPIKTQNVALETEFNRWKKDLEQLDDVCCMGIEV